MNQQIVTAMKTAVRKIERANKKMNLDEIDVRNIELETTETLNLMAMDFI